MHMKAKDQSRFSIEALRDRAGEAVFARGEAYQGLRRARQPVCGRGRQSRICGAAKLIVRMAALQSMAEQAAYVAALKMRHGQKRNFMKLLG
jgi:hypothetical protein